MDEFGFMPSRRANTAAWENDMTSWMVRYGPGVWRELTAQLSPNRFFGRVVRLFRPSFVTKPPAAGPQNGPGIQP